MSHRLNSVNPKFEFQTRDGKKIKNLYGLSRELARMDDSVFSHHVSEHKNDFKSWVFDIVKDYTLAKQLTKANSKVKMHKIVKQRIYDLEKATENVANLDSLASNSHSEKLALKSLFAPSKTLKKPKSKKLELDVKSYLAKLNGGQLNHQLARPMSKRLNNPVSKSIKPIRTPVFSRRSNLIEVLSAKSKWKFNSKLAKPTRVRSRSNLCPPKKNNVSDVSHLFAGATSDISHVFKGATSDVSHLFKSENEHTKNKHTKHKSIKNKTRKQKKKPSILSFALKKLNPRLQKRKSAAEKIKKRTPSKRRAKNHFKLPFQIRDVRATFNLSRFSLPSLSLPALPLSNLHKLGKSEWKHFLLDVAILGIGVTIGIVMLKTF